jgi:exodeoxyribonuclease-3
MDTVAGWLRDRRPDALCIQETKASDPDFPREAFENAGYKVAFRGEKSYNGVAVAAIAEPAETRFGLDDGDSPDETRLVYVRLGSVHIVNTYVPQGREIDHPMYAYKLNWFRRLREYFKRHFSPGMKVVWTGDLNVAPEPKDIYNAADQANHVCYHEAVRKAFAETTAWGFTDVFRKHHPEPGQYSFFDYRLPGAVAKGRGWRVDHILATAPMARNCRDSFIDLEPRKGPRPSDHTFVVADFNV